MSAIFDVRAALNKCRLPADLKALLIELLERNVSRTINAAKVGPRKLSIRTQERRTMAIGKSFEELRQNGFALQSPYSLKHKHVEFLVNFWVRRKLTGGTIENKLTHLRAIADWMSKPDLVSALADYVDREEHNLVLWQAPPADESWEANGIDADMKIKEVAATDRNVAVQLKLQTQFGLRVEESFLLRPKEAIRDDGLLGVTGSTRGGRDRVVPISLRFAALEEAAALSNPYTGSTIPHGYTKQQWRDHYYHVLHKHGITRSGHGVTSRGLRHQFLQEMYKTLASVPAPIKRHEESASVELHRKARQCVVEVAGRSRALNANAYLTRHEAAALERARLAQEVVEQALVDARGVKSRAAAKLGISRQSLYRLLERASYPAAHKAATSKRSPALTPEAAKQAIEEAGGVKRQAAAMLGISPQALYRLLERDRQ
ncbi:helix-turn-helix domain-containing protein [Paraburkholderia sp. 22098]|uniref:helix-turn-helix domain-containing protein n=1 Tax=Paraburkholderia sp. 22098 TaxID=3453874 RepID=UPI003F859892